MRKKFTEKQIHILDVAEELIAQKGYEGTSVRDISSKANINVAMISYYFGSKEKMMTYLYQYRVLKTRENFSEFAEAHRIDNIINTIINSPNNSEEAPNKVDNFINYFNTPLSIPPYNPFKPISYIPNVIKEQYKINDPIKDNVRDTVRQIITDKQNETIFNSSPSIIKPISEIISEIPVLKIPSDKLPIVGNNNGIFEEIDDIIDFIYNPPFKDNPINSGLEINNDIELEIYDQEKENIYNNNIRECRSVDDVLDILNSLKVR